MLQEKSQVNGLPFSGRDWETLIEITNPRLLGSRFFSCFIFLLKPEALGIVIWNFHQLPPLDFDNEDELNPKTAIVLLTPIFPGGFAVSDCPFRRAGNQEFP